MSYARDAAAAARAARQTISPQKGAQQHAPGPGRSRRKISPKAQPYAKGQVYLAGPILGKTYTDCRFGWRQEVAMRMLPGIQVLSPMRHEGHLAEHIGPIDDGVINKAEYFFSESKIIFAKDVLDIRSCDIMLANFLGATVPSLGTVSEIGMAYILNKTIITVIEDDNIHRHPFVLEPSALVLDNLDDAITAINRLLRVGM